MYKDDTSQRSAYPSPRHYSQKRQRPAAGHSMKIAGGDNKRSSSQTAPQLQARGG
jgi:hypothetical protein